MDQLTHPFNINESAIFPSLYIPQHSLLEGEFLYSRGDIWQCTLLWTIIFYEAFHIAASLYAVALQPRNWKFSWLIVLLYMIVGGIEAFVAGSVVGLILHTVYTAGGFRMSTWIPLIWGLINVLVLTLSSFSIHGGL